jgi:metal-responsive CopG/Arc/MetJ family transcriptional regulator
VVNGCGGADMKRRKVAANSVNYQNEASSVRATISFPSDVYATLDEIAKQKKVSLAWVVREATEKYLADKWPLLKGQG